MRARWRRGLAGGTALMLLLDTHVFVWLSSDPRQLSEGARAAVKKNAGRIFISSISALEMAILVKRKRLTLPLEFPVFWERALSHHGIGEIPVDWRIAHHSVLLPDVHNDPFDRIIVATAQLHNLAILSKDQTLPSYPDTVVVWS